MFGQFKINHLDSSGEASTSAVKKWKTGSVLEMLKAGEKRLGAEIDEAREVLSFHGI